MPDTTLISLALPLLADATSTSQASERLRYHKSMLEAQGITSLSALGKLTVRGPVAAQAGLAVPSGTTGTATLYQGALAPLSPPVIGQKTLTLGPSGGTAQSLALKPPAPPPPGAAAVTLPINTAYWVAEWIELQENTTVVFKQPLQYLVIIAEKLTVGPNVTFTYERPRIGLPPTPPKPAKPPRAPTPDGLWGVTGTPGTAGVAGNRGVAGVSAPQLEIWVIDMVGTPIFDLSGQDGGQGGQGQYGGDGGDGSTGRAELYDWLGFCKSGPGNGGNGGPGGAAGAGGQGGAGGTGGRLRLYAPRPVIDAFGAGFFVGVDGGRGGPGGMPGVPGAGGAGGQVGAHPKNCATSSPRTAGAPGPMGAVAWQGPGGAGGTRSYDALGFVPIDADMLRTQLTVPALMTINPGHAMVGTHVSVQGRRFSRSDTLLIEGNAAPADAVRIVSDTLLDLVVPPVAGGVRTLQLRQSDGTLSNRATLYVLPQVTRAGDTARLRPGTRVTLRGSGFAPGCLVRINGQDMPDVQCIDPGTVVFTLLRPTDVPASASGESVSLAVVLSDGTASEPVTVVLETFHMLVVGDSVQWGQGLPQDLKFHALVEQAVRARNGGIGFYKTSRAHSGAVIGWDNQGVIDPLNGEVPSSLPSIRQQVEGFTDAPHTLDLILVDGGINDVTVGKILWPDTPPDELAADVETYCHDHMVLLLGALRGMAPKATLVVTGYFPIVSEQSDIRFFGPLLAVVNLLRFGLVGGLAGAYEGTQIDEQIKTRMSNLARLFDERSRDALTRAVSEVNAATGPLENGQPAIRFADPAFGPAHSVFTADPWLYGVSMGCQPQDNLVMNERADFCNLCYPPQTSPINADREICYRASLGHPNAAGARRYADVILAALGPDLVSAG